MGTRFSGEDNIFAPKGELYLQEDYTPETLPEREEEMQKIEMGLTPATRGVGAQNLFIYGKAGQGKTASTKVILDELETHAEEESNHLDLTVVDTSLEGIGSSYALGCHLTEELTGENPNGHPENKVYEHLWDALGEVGNTIIILLDEIDNLGADDTLLYSLPRARDKGYVSGEVFPSVIGISNDLQWRDGLDPRVKDSLYDEPVFFSPYEARHLQQILSRRALNAFQDTRPPENTASLENITNVESEVLAEGVIPLVAAFAASDKGSARQALKLLRKAANLAEVDDTEMVMEAHVRKAETQIEKERIVEGMEELTIQGQLALASVVILELSGSSKNRTKEVYNVYTALAQQVGIDAIAMRRVRDHLQELDMLGILEGKKRASGGVGGPAYKFSLKVDSEMAKKALLNNDRIEVSDIDDLVRTSKQGKLP